MSHVENGRITETETEARVGTTGHNVRYVLIVGTGAATILFTVIYLSFFG